MKRKINKKFIFLILVWVFFISLGFFDSCFAKASPDGCVGWDTYCVDVSATADLSWNALTQIDIDQLRSDCTLSSVNYTVEIIGLGTKGAGGSTSYSWTGLTPDTTYQWKVKASYQCSISWKSGSVLTNTYSFTSAVCGQPPSAVNLKVVQPDYCLSGPAGIFSWTFSGPGPGDTQSAYQVQVDNNSDFSSPEDDSGKVSSISNSYATILGKLNYNNTYYWRLKVWDNNGAGSNWISGPNFTTPVHAYPSIDFSWAPQIPSINEDVSFTDQSTIYGGASKLSWSWTFQDGSPASSSQQNPTVKFFSIGEKLITLRVTDSDGYSCPGSKTLNAEFPLPKWKEIAPF